MHLTATEEKYIVAICKLGDWGKKPTTTSALALALQTSAAAATEMLQKLHAKKLVKHKKYSGAVPTQQGKHAGTLVLRRQRLWQVFLVHKLKLQWEAVQDIARKLSDVACPILLQRLDDFLGNPTYSPFGKPIPGADGKCASQSALKLTNVAEGHSTSVVAIKENHPTLLQYLHKLGIYIGAQIIVIEKIAFDGSMTLSIDNQRKINVSQKVTDNILVQK